jgi:HsdM-like protein
VNWVANFIWGIADDVLRDLYVRGKCRDVILPMTVLRRLELIQPRRGGGVTGGEAAGRHP